MSLYPSTMAVLGWWTKKALSTLRFYLGGWAIVLAGACHFPGQSAASLDQCVGWMSLYPSTMVVLGWWTKKALSTLRFYLGGWTIVLAGARHCPRAKRRFA
ncbi:hypothetical protein [Phytopseudomonas daroniae]|uniref:hypothetical protein n=1 Tax=Pseudomonadaceae TaxID=135621 RepID=UPI0010377D8F|nr:MULTISPECIES: hypothetical protein [Pseudomonas]